MIPALLALENLAFAQLHRKITADLCALGNYTPADDNDDEEYDELYTHPVQNESIYILRESDHRTLTISAQDYDFRDIHINSLKEWEQYRKLLTTEGGLPLEKVPPEVAKAIAEKHAVSLGLATGQAI
jgi:hypothetical protein